MNEMDDRIVKLELDNKDFEKNAKESIKTTEELKEAMKFENSSKALEEFSRQLTAIEQNTNTANEGIQRLASATTTVFGKLVNSLKTKVADTIESVVTTPFKNLGNILTQAFSQIESGGWSRASNLKNAEFQLKGLGVTGKKLAKVMEDVNYGVSGTAYGLDAAAKAASQLTASGVKAGDEMKAALRGISGVAAMTNSTYEDISSIFTTVAGNGKLMTQQLRQFSFRGLNAAATLGQQLGKTEAQINEMVTKGQIDFETFSKAMDDAFGEHAKDANETYTGSLANMKAALSRIGADIATAKLESMVGVFNACREAINSLHKQFQPLLDTLASLTNIKNHALRDFVNGFTEIDESGTRVIKTGYKLKEMAEGISRIMWNVRSVLYAFQLGLKDVLGESDPLVKIIGGLSSGINSLSKATQPSADTLVKIRQGVRALATPLKAIGDGISFVTSKITEGMNVIRNSKVVQMISDFAGGMFSKAAAEVTNFKISWQGMFLSKNLKFGEISKSVTTLVKKVKELAGQSETLAAIKEKFSNVSLEGIIDKLASGLNVLLGIVKKLYEQLSNSKVWSIIKTLATNLLVTLDKNLASVIKNGQNIFSTIRSNVHLLNTLKSGINFIKTAMSGIVPFLVSGAKHIASLITGVKDFTEALRPANEVVKATVTIMDDPVALAGPNNTIAKVVELGEAVDENVNKPGLVDRIKQFGETVANMFKSIGEGYRTNKTSIEKGFAMFKAIVWYIMGLVTWVSVIKQMNTVTKTMNSASKMLDNIGYAFKTFADKVKAPFSNITNITNNIKNVGANTPILVQLSAMILSVAASVKILSTIDEESLKRSAITLGALGGLMGAIAIVLKIITVKVVPEGKKFASSGVAATIMALALSLLSIATAVKMLDSVKFNNGILDNIITLGGVLAALGGVVVLISKYSGTHSLKSVAVIIALTLSLSSLIRSFIKLNENLEGVSWERWGMSVASLGVAIAAIAALGVIMSKVAFKGAIGLVAIVLTASKVADIVNNLLENLNWDVVKEKIVKYQDTLMGVLKIAAIMTVVAALLGPRIEKFTAGIMKFAAAALMVGVLARVVKGLEDNDIDHAINLLIWVTGLLGTLLAIISVLPIDKDKIKNVSKMIGRITRFYLAMGVLTALIGLIPDDIMTKGINTLKEFTKMIGAIILCTAAAKGVKMGTLIALTGAFITLMGAVLILGVMPADMLEQGLKACLRISLSLAAIFVSLWGIKQSYDKSVVGVILSGVAGLVAIAGALYFLSDRDWPQLTAAAIALVGTVVAVGLILKALMKINYTKNGFARAAYTLLTAIGLLGSISLALMFLSFADPIGLVAGMIALNLTLATMTLCLETLMSINYTKNGFKRAGYTILTAVGLLGSIAGALYLVSQNEWSSILAAGAAISGVLLSFSVMLGIMKGMGSNAQASIANAVAIVIAGAVLFEIAGALMMVAGAGDWTQILSAMAAVTVVLGALGGVLFVLSAMSENIYPAIAAAVALAIAGISIIEIGSVLGKLAQYDWANILVAAGAVTLVLVALAGSLVILAALSENVYPAIIGAAALIIAGISLIEIGHVLGKLAQYDWKSLEEASKAITRVLLALTACTAVMGLLGPLAIEGAAVLDAVALILGVGLMLVFELIGQLYSKCENVEQGLDFIILIAGKLGEAFGAFIGGVAKGTMEQLNSAADDLVEFGNKFTEFANTLKEIEAIDPDWTVVTDILWAIANMSKTGLITSLEDFISSKLFGNDNSLQKMLMEFSDSMTTLTTALSGANGSVLKHGLVVIKQFETDLDAISNLADKYSDMDNIASFSSQMKELGDLGIAEFANALANADVRTGITNLFIAIQNAVTSTKAIALLAFKNLGIEMSLTINGFYDRFYQSGLYLISGLTAGLTNATSMAALRAAASQLGDTVDTSFRENMDIHSPSVKMAKNGKYVVEGLAQGVGQNGSIVVDEIDELADKVDRTTLLRIKQCAKKAKEEGKTGTKYVYSETKKQAVQETEDLLAETGNTLIDGFDDMKKELETKMKGIDFGEFSTVIKSKMNTITAIFAQYGEIDAEAFFLALTASLKDGKSWDEALQEAFKSVTGEVLNLDDIFAGVGGSADDASDAVDGLSDSLDSAGGSASDAAEKAKTLAKYNWIVEQSAGAVNAAFGLMSSNLSDTSSVISTMGVNFDQVAESMYYASRTGSEAFDDMFNETGASLDDFRAKVVETFESLLDSFEDTFDMMSSASNPFEGMLSAKDMIRNLQDQAAQVSSVGVKMTRLAMKGINQELLQELAEGGVSSLSQINSLLRASSEEIQEINTLYLQKSSVSQISAIQSVNAMAIAAQREIYEAQAATGDATAQVLLQYSKLESDAIDYINEYLDRYEYASSLIRDTVADSISTFEEFDFTVEKSAQDFVNNMWSQVEGARQWEANLEKIIAMGASDELIESLVQMGQDGGFEIAAALASGTAENIASANAAMIAQNNIPDELAAKFGDAYGKAGNASADQFIADFAALLQMDPDGKILQSCGIMAADTCQELKQYLINGGDGGEGVKKVCTNFLNAMADTMRTQERIPTKQAEYLGLHTVQATGKNVNQPKGQQEGKWFTQGLLQGIQNGSGPVVAAAWALGANILAQLHAALGNGSPSKLAKQEAIWFEEGIIIGFKSMADEVEAAANDTNNPIIESLKEAMAQSTEILEDADVTPTITPVLDLSQIQNGSGLLTNMLSSALPVNGLVGNMSFGAATRQDFTTMMSDAVKNGLKDLEFNNNVNYTQNNYSPKELSSIDIYRQTKNQLSALKGALK